MKCALADRAANTLSFGEEASRVSVRDAAAFSPEHNDSRERREGAVSIILDQIYRPAALKSDQGVENARIF